ncbi:hypothetical protein COU24_03340, partial [Candidatus Kuenenbacteria bacterium CG10_big_fil_rev_8_21_14_0_10_39_14]
NELQGGGTGLILIWQEKSGIPPTPPPFCPPELKSFSKFSVRIFTKKSSDFVQRSDRQSNLETSPA